MIPRALSRIMHVTVRGQDEILLLGLILRQSWEGKDWKGLGKSDRDRRL